MKKSNFSKPQIIKMLTLQEQDKSISEICREQGIIQSTFYKWKSKYSGMDVSQVKQLKDLEWELDLYKKIVVEITAENTILKGVIEKSSKACRKVKAYWIC